MGQVVRHDRAGGATGANSLWRRAVSVLLCICFVVLALQPASAFDAPPARDLSMLVTASGLDQAPDGSTDGAPAQHCAHCACHQATSHAMATSVPARPVTQIRFDVSEAAIAARATPPPSEPPIA